MKAHRRWIVENLWNNFGKGQKQRTYDERGGHSPGTVAPRAEMQRFRCNEKSA
jgi:hypothetical protein